MKKDTIFLLLCVGIHFLLVSQESERLPIYKIKNTTKCMVDFALELSATMQTKLVPVVQPADLSVYNEPEVISVGIQPKTEIVNLFDLIQGPRLLLPIPEMIVRIRATFYEKQYQWSTQSDPFEVVYFNGPLPKIDTTFLLTGPDTQGHYHIIKQ